MTNKSEYIVNTDNLVYKREHRLILDGVTVNVPRGKVTAIMGPSGCGKTTLLKLMSGQLKPNSGNVNVKGESVLSMSLKKLYKMRRRMGMLFQSGALFTDLNVYENVAYPIREHTNLPETLIRNLVYMKLEAVGLRGAIELMPSELSGGMARRVALARAIALDPEIIFYDEPFTGQDPISMGVLLQLIRLLNDALNMTTIIVSHDVEETMSIADYIYILADGNILGHGTPLELSKNNSGWLRQFLDGLPDGPVPFHYPAPKFKDALMREVSKCNY